MFDFNICKNKEKNIYEDLKGFYHDKPGVTFSYQDFEITGLREFKVLYNKIKPLKKNQRVKLGNELIDLLIDYIREPKKEVFENIKGYMALNPVSDYYEEFIKSFKALIESFKQFKDDLTLFLKKLIFEGNSHDEIKLGLMMSCTIKINNIEEVLRVLSISNEYIFYVIKVYETMNNCNERVFYLAQNSRGYGKAICVHELQPVSNEIIEWLILYGLEDNFGYLESLEYSMLSVNLLKYLKSGRINESNIRLLSKSFSVLFSEYAVNDIENGINVCFEYFKLVNMYGKDIYSLYGVISGIYSIDTFIFQEYGFDSIDKITSIVPQYDKLCDLAGEIYIKSIWGKVILKEIGNIDLDIEVLVEAMEKTNFEISNDEFIGLLERDYTNPALYRYGLEKGNKELKKSIYDAAYNRLPMKDICNREKETIDLDDLIIKPMYHLCFYFLVKGIEYDELPKEYKRINFDALNASLVETYKLATNNLIKIKDEFSKEDKKFIEEKLTEESLKNSLLSLIDSGSNKKREYMEINIQKIIPHVKDIYLMSTYIDDIRYRDLSVIKNINLEEEMLYLFRDNGNPYDENAIKIVTKQGYVLGYIPRRYNLIIKNMIDNGKYFYALISKVSGDFEKIDIMIYLSYKDVIDEITNTMSLLYNKKGKYLQ
ncbi:HIRAN domain-containing protein [Clostridium taeniosporum]|uniref:DNA-binding protein n=1 Tax=Clostridium taeniosporum TaxID=394958 RepID=A0A1D7XKY2_9CLOT|nr:HIRAN domain-containing protein [Clostridium taeniosporum]AOR23998.1 DNA-binding protein [Clostridium taeniosporum]